MNREQAASEQAAPTSAFILIPAFAQLRRGKSARQVGFWYQLKLGSATVPVAVRNVPLRTFPKHVRRDAGRSVRDARAP